MADRFAFGPLEVLSGSDGQSIDLSRFGSELPVHTGEWLLYLAVQNQTNTNLLLQEIRRMATNDASLVQAVTDLTNAYTSNTSAISAEIANLQSAIQPGTDPAITTAVANIEGIVAQMNSATTAAQAAIAPVANTVTTSTPTPTSAAAPAPTSATPVTTPAASATPATAPTVPGAGPAPSAAAS